MTSIDDLQPIRVIRLRRRRTGSQLRAFIRGLCIGYFGGAALLLLGMAANSLFPPPQQNLLLLGLDRRPGQSGASRADTMILVAIDPDRPYVGMLSIPRDLWITLPDGRQNRINTAYFFAEAAAPGTGPQAAMAAVESNFGIPIDHYLTVDFTGFVRIIDSLGGVTVNVERRIVDNEYPTDDFGTQVVVFEPGVQHMDGERALQYARTRHSSSDFDRARRQQAILAAFGRRLLQPDAWLRLPALYVAVVSSVDTTMRPVEIVRLLPTLAIVGPDGLDRRVIEGSMVRPFTTSGGAAVQLPVWETINPVLLEMFGE
jgi:polyisoprenyl-teichoic acid--peptidoglycan teichoic acid transferase